LHPLFCELTQPWRLEHQSIMEKRDDLSVAFRFRRNATECHATSSWAPTNATHV
jgi:hypothetical protein